MNRPYRVCVAESADAFPGPIVQRRTLATFASEDAAWARIDKLRSTWPDLILSVRFAGKLIRRSDRLYNGARSSEVAS